MQKSVFCTLDPGIKLLYKNNTVNHGDVLSISSIGEDDMALICMTDRKNCCKSLSSGEWYYPNGTQVQIGGNNWRFYRNRKDNPGQVLLNQRTDHVHSEEPGEYCCVIPDKDSNCDFSQRICVNLGRPFCINIMHARYSYFKIAINLYLMQHPLQQLFHPKVLQSLERN